MNRTHTPKPPLQLQRPQQLQQSQLQPETITLTRANLKEIDDAFPMYRTHTTLSMEQLVKMMRETRGKKWPNNDDCQSVTVML